MKKPKPIADPEEQNDERAEWARAAVQTFMRETGLSEADGLDTAISDLLADLAHLCDREGLQLSALLNRAEFHYNDETSAGLTNRPSRYRAGEQFDSIRLS